MTAHASPPLVQVGALPRIDTAVLFQARPVVLSPIDSFIANTNAINRILAGMAAHGAPSPELCSLVLLGYLSAVETYFRTMLSRLAHVDPVTMRMLGNKNVLFSVAMTRPRESLAEALYEDSFASAKELRARLTEVGMSKLPQEVENAVAEYDKICHIRHCCVHRFGYLGTRNAEELGMAGHRHLIGAIFSTTDDRLADIADALQQFVKTCNNHVFRFAVDRTIDDQHKFPTLWARRWRWTYQEDHRLFRPYYDLFAVKRDRPASRTMREVYASFMNDNAAKVRGMASRAAAGPQARVQAPVPGP